MKKRSLKTKLLALSVVLILAALCLLMGLFPEVLLDVIGKAVML